MKTKYHLFRAYTSMLFFDVLGWCIGTPWEKSRRESKAFYKIIKIAYKRRSLQ